MENTTKIIIVDDHQLFREGIKLLIELEGLGKVIAEAENGQIFLEILEELNPDLVLMDIEMPVMNGKIATQKALLIRPNLKILALTMLCEKENYADMIKAGVMGFVMKTSGKNELENAIKTVIRGESYLSKELLRQIIVDSERQPVPKEDTEVKENIFTDRELEVLGYFSKGLTASEIAEIIFRSVKTVESHRSKLLEKTNTRNTINLVLYAIKNKIVEI